MSDKKTLINLYNDKFNFFIYSKKNIDFKKKLCYRVINRSVVNENSAQNTSVMSDRNDMYSWSFCSRW